MLRTLTLAALTAFAFSVSGAAAKPAAYIAKAVADPHRPSKDTDLDAARKPAAMLEFARIRPGMVVVDFDPGEGYFTRLFSTAVGPKGHVYAFVPGKRGEGRKPAVYAVADDPAYANVTVLRAPLGQFVTPQRVDVVWTSQNYHDLHNALAPEQVIGFDKDVYQSLKPGGEFIVLDHRAKAGSGLADTHTLHRIDPAVVRHEVEAAGFKFAGQSKVLANPKDDLTLRVFDPKIRHHTDQFIFRFIKPRK